MQDRALVQALYWLDQALGGSGYSVPFGLLVAGISVSAGLAKLLPKWIVVPGLLIAVCGEVSWINLVVPKALFPVPLTRFPGFVWLTPPDLSCPKRSRDHHENIRGFVLFQGVAIMAAALTHFGVHISQVWSRMCDPRHCYYDDGWGNFNNLTKEKALPSALRHPYNAEVWQVAKSSERFVV